LTDYEEVGWRWRLDNPRLASGHTTYRPTYSFSTTCTLFELAIIGERHHDPGTDTGEECRSEDTKRVEALKAERARVLCAG